MPETSTLLHLSTCHVTKQTAKLLDGETDFHMAKHEYGWFVWVDSDVAVRGDKDWPADLAACVAYAHNLGCRWICFDRDADEVDALPKYEW
ncbi:hypothetical protein IVA80_10875 [Bradyrhizobium sp. 139]|uniref:DUF5983 family protein n=1 Tax=Bradyrhizobium sp. 139 TaxID=2782616 RepID=UPI001FF84ADC|nr:hypothetical protein [Bradyrhizobium sp. 139]MCK1741353.1 hypothetical protein [Bradyrhizobium sp. 139]